MESGIPQHHPLRRLFNALTERSFSEKLGWPDLNITQYVANLLVEFTHTNQLYKVRNQRDQRVDTVIDLLYESEVLLGAQSLDRERDVHQHIGDFTLFGSHASTVIFATRSGMGSSPIHFVASAYDFPAERSDAATSASSNHGWFESKRTNACPTAPVAPSTATVRRSWPMLIAGAP